MRHLGRFPDKQEERLFSELRPEGGLGGRGPWLWACGRVATSRWDAGAEVRACPCAAWSRGLGQGPGGLPRHGPRKAWGAAHQTPSYLHLSGYGLS